MTNILKLGRLKLNFISGMKLDYYSNNWSYRICLSILMLIFQIGCTRQNPVVLITTSLGNITVEIYEREAPITSANFLRYVDDNRFAAASFYRTVRMDNQPENDVRIEVIQGGLESQDRMYPPISHETTETTGIFHKDGVISMARDEPGTATSEFFICIGDQPELDFGGRRNPDGQGFAAFGRVIEGMEVVRMIQEQPAEEQKLTPDVSILSITKLN